jgi:hypothetical protein
MSAECVMMRGMIPNIEAVTVADDLLGSDIEWRTATARADGPDPNVLVLSSDPIAAAEVLKQVTPRFYDIDEDGEYMAVRGDVAPGDEPYTPNWVSGVYLIPEGAFVLVDSKSMIFPAMVRTMVGMLVDALTEAGVPSHLAPGSRVDSVMLKRGNPYGDEVDEDWDIEQD